MISGKQNQNIAEICQLTGLDTETVQALQQEGHHPLYVHALLQKGLDLGKPNPAIGEKLLQLEKEGDYAVADKFLKEYVKQEYATIV
ncbi:hypothetical protein HYX14_04170 [Candidatus Woesearchaeota archaeon]|nr:hypothetical protein [Candidatus Woesearchaeota archaeon]